MIESEDALELGELVRRLRAVDRSFRVFGSGHHQYRFGPILSERDLIAFETSHGVRLPEDYRCFLALVGNGGAGPFYGLEPLENCEGDLSRPFALTQATEQLTATELLQLGNYDPYPGVLEFCHQGCAIYSYLVVNGPTYGTIWDGREDFYPSGLTFGVWYRNWAERALRILGNEHRVAYLRVGMTEADVNAAVPADWQSRWVSTTRLLEAPEIAVQLELDERGIVVNVNPWPSISARPW